jgi:hypothetical protein
MPVLGCVPPACPPCSREFVLVATDWTGRRCRRHQPRAVEVQRVHAVDGFLRHLHRLQHGSGAGQCCVASSDACCLRHSFRGVKPFVPIRCPVSWARRRLKQRWTRTLLARTCLSQFCTSCSRSWPSQRLVSCRCLGRSTRVCWFIMSLPPSHCHLIVALPRRCLSPGCPCLWVLRRIFSFACPTLNRRTH